MTAIVWITHALAFVLRGVGFFGLSGAGLLGLWRHEPKPTSHLLVFAGLGCLSLSRLLVMPDPATALLLFLLLGLLLVVDVTFTQRAQLAADLFLPVAFLLGVGGALFFDTMPVVSVDAGTATKQVILTVLGCVACFLAFQFVGARGNAGRLSNWYWVWFCLAVLVSLLPLTPLRGPAITDAAGNVIDASHISVPFNFQPVELAKVLVIVGLSGYIAHRTRNMAAMRLPDGLLPLGIISVVLFGVEAYTKDLGSMAVTILLVAVMLVLCNRSEAKAVSATYLLVGIGLLALGAWYEYRSGGSFTNRVNALVGTFQGFFALPDPDVEAFKDVIAQQYQAGRAVGNGGLLGTGLGLGYHLGNVSYVHSDMVMAAVGSELGLVGLFEVFLAYVMFVRRALLAATVFPRGRFDSNLLMGVAALVAIQACVILGGSLSLIPLTGVTLPFLSAGGSSIVCLMLLMGIVGGALSVANPGAGRAPDVSQGRGGVRAAFDGWYVWLPQALIICLLGVFLLRAGGFQPGPRICGISGRELSFNVVTCDGRVLLSRTSTGIKDSSEFPQGSEAAHVLSSYANPGNSSIASLAVTNSDNYREQNVGTAANVLGIPETLPDMSLTLDNDVQLEAELQLEDTYGAIVAMDVHSGQLLAVASSPATTPEEMKDIYERESESEAYDPDGEKRINRAFGVTYLPGSTFKTVTMAAALENGVAGPDTVVNGDNLTLSNGLVVYNHGHEDYGRITLRQALDVSSNAAFGRLGIDLGANDLASMAQRFGFDGNGDALTVPNVVPSTFGWPSNDYALAWAADGQADVDGTGGGPWTTVLQMCTVAATVANGGVRVDPYLIESGSSLTADDAYVGPFGSHQVLDEEDAGTLWDMMVESATSAANSFGVSQGGLTIAGKTGTAEVGTGTRCWYIGATRDVAVACCIEADADDLGGSVAQPRAIPVLEAAQNVVK